MKILILTDGDLISTITINKIVKKFYNKNNILIVIDDYVSANPSMFKMDILSITGAKSELDNVITENDRNITKENFENKKFKKMFSLERLSSFENVSFTHIYNINKNIDFIKNYKPDTVLSIRLRNILKIPTIEACGNNNVFNFHSGTLPEFRGVYSLLRAIIQDYKYSGCTFHRIEDEGIDSGKIVFKNNIKINFNKSYQWNLMNIYNKSMPTFLKKLTNIVDGKEIIYQEQNKSTAKYYSFPNENDVNLLLTKLPSIIDIYDIKKIINLFS
ncbi:MAG TPA: formyltransferase family protein [Rickettsiales bacterium]|nr:formyltransferase family protein [Rickettsiales bacterium]